LVQWSCKPGAIAAAAAILLLSSTLCRAAYEAEAPQGVDLTGYWKLNTALSDDPERLLQQRLEEERKARERWMRKMREAEDPLGIPPPDAPLPPATDSAPAAEPRPPQSHPPRNRHLDEMRQMLGISDTLAVTQQGSRIQIQSQVDSRSFDAGTKSQVSMPQGELADSRVGWEGGWFVIDRRAKRGPTMLEKYRLNRKTDQLESLLVWGGDSPLAGIKVHRVYDRMLTAPPPPDPERGPVR